MLNAEYSELRELLREGASRFSAVLEDRQLEMFFRYMELLKEWNEKMNLTAIEENRDVIVKHFIDSLSIIPWLGRKEGSLIDIGTGAGFPGIPVKIAVEGIKVTLLDSLEKRVKFLNEVIKELKLTGITAVHSRAEDFGAAADSREKFDFATARAVANLPVLLEYCLPFVRRGGVFIAMKGSSIEEVENSKKALDVLGGRLTEVNELTLPSSDIKRNIIIVRKFRQTPTKYPRKAGKPLKDPLI
jgi:16S rRNA (guanine527-N7)-methyltransferase